MNALSYIIQILLILLELALGGVLIWGGVELKSYKKMPKFVSYLIWIIAAIIIIYGLIAVLSLFVSTGSTSSVSSTGY